MNLRPVTIVGAGLSGLIAARDLVASGDAQSAVNSRVPSDVLVLDKGRGVGGRLATRRIGGATVDHGAQFFTVRSDDLRTDVDRWIAAGVVEEWCQGFSEVDGYPRYRAVGGMKELARHLGAELERDGVEICTDERVSAITAGEDGWRIDYESSRASDHTRGLIMTPPVPQTLELLAAGAVELPDQHRETLAPLTYHKVIALLALLDRSPDLAQPGALQQPADPTFTFVADNQAKGISEQPAMTFHTAHQLSAELWSADDDSIIERLSPEVDRLRGAAEIIELQVKRWRYAGPVTPLPEACLTVLEEPGALILAGDGFGGSKVEGAYRSGRAAAAQVTALA